MDNEALAPPWRRALKPRAPPPFLDPLGALTLGCSNMVAHLVRPGVPPSPTANAIIIGVTVWGQKKPQNWAQAPDGAEEMDYCLSVV